MKRVNRFLLRERYESKDLFDEIQLHLDLVGGTLSGDDTVKIYLKVELVPQSLYFCSGG